MYYVCQVVKTPTIIFNNPVLLNALICLKENWSRLSYFDNIEMIEDAVDAICLPEVEGWPDEFLKFIWISIISNFMHKCFVSYCFKRSSIYYSV